MTEERFQELQEIASKLKKREALIKLFQEDKRVTLEADGVFIELDKELFDSFKSALEGQLEKYQNQWEEA